MVTAVRLHLTPFSAFFSVPFLKYCYQKFIENEYSVCCLNSLYSKQKVLHKCIALRKILSRAWRSNSANSTIKRRFKRLFARLSHNKIINSYHWSRGNIYLFTPTSFSALNFNQLSQMFVVQIQWCSQLGLDPKLLKTMEILLT